MNHLQSGDYDREPTLNDLMSQQSRNRIQRACEIILGEHFALLDSEKQTLFGNMSSDLQVLPLVVELEPLGYLAYSSEKDAQAQALQIMIQDTLQSSWRYQMASSLHKHVVQQDYDELLMKHRQLQASEHKYKQLSENLEHRVQLQVAKIEASQRQLYEAEKMTSIGQLAAGVAHEINNPIGFIKSNLKTAEEYREELNQFFEKMLKINSLILDTLFHNMKLDLDVFGCITRFVVVSVKNYGLIVAI